MKILPVLILAAVAACSPQQSTHAEPTGAAVSDTDDIIARFTDDIWPAINNYNRHPGQGNYPKVATAYSQFWDILDKELTTDEWKQATAAASNLAGVNGDDINAIRLSDLLPAQVRVTALNPPDATLRVCYTYTVDEKHPHPAASEVTVGLALVDNTWYLHSVTDDHVVPGCGSANG